MVASRVLATAGSVVAVAVVAAVVIQMANARPHGAPEQVTALTSAATSTPTATSRTYPVGSAPSPSATPGRPSTPRPTTTRRTPLTTPRPSTPATTHPPASSSHPPAAPHGQSLPLGFTTGSATRVVTVVAASYGSTTATLQAWDKAAGGGWVRRGGAVLAHVGSDGLTSSPSETRSATPIGSFGLTLAFGSRGNPGTGLPYIHTDSASWWISTSGSTYNTYQHCSNCGYGDPDEHLASIWQYGYAVVIDYNRFPVTQGAGSAFFLHITDGGATAGCVSVPQADLVAIMRWLTPSAHPRILIGVG